MKVIRKIKESGAAAVPNENEEEFERYRRLKKNRGNFVAGKNPA